MSKLNYKVAVLLAMVFACITCFGASPTYAAASSGVVNINSANVTQLKLLKGIGLKKARAIIDYRQKKKFETVEELIKVKGIGKKLIEKLRANLAVDGNTTMKSFKKKTKKKRKNKG